ELFNPTGSSTISPTARTGRAAPERPYSTTTGQWSRSLRWIVISNVCTGHPLSRRTRPVRRPRATHRASPIRSRRFRSQTRSVSFGAAPNLASSSSLSSGGDRGVELVEHLQRAANWEAGQQLRQGRLVDVGLVAGPAPLERIRQRPVDV